ncbi:MAG TPA: hypothetical protein VMW54_04670 [Terriglobia bacterium]|nr:hypothetical protein [Terriglobia bacterium]
MRRTQNIIALCAGTLLFLLTGAWAQQAPSTTSQPVAGGMSSSSKKPKKWHGKLVDSNCMAKTLNTVAVSALHGTAEGAPSPSGSSSEFRQYQAVMNQTNPMTQHGPDQPHSAVGPAIGTTGNPPQAPQGAGGNGPSISAAAMQRGAMLEHAAKECTATSTTSQFGLLTDSGAVMKFGESGNSKASQAVKGAALKPKKAVKATVRGVESNRGPVLVTSVEINH